MVSSCCIATRVLPLVYFFPIIFKLLAFKGALFQVQFIHFVRLPNQTIVDKLTNAFFVDGGTATFT